MFEPKSVVVIALALLPGVAVAQAQPGSGAYVGGSIGQMEADGDCDPGLTCDLKDTAWKIFGGYRFNRYFAVEGTYGNWGEITVSTVAAGIPINVTGDIQSFGVAAVGMLPLGDRFSLFGKAGLAYTKRELKATAPGFSFQDEKDNETELHFGFGALFNLTPSFSLRGEWERLDDSEVNIISLGLQFRF